MVRDLGFSTFQERRNNCSFIPVVLINEIRNFVERSYVPPMKVEVTITVAYYCVSLI